MSDIFALDGGQRHVVFAEILLTLYTQRQPSVLYRPSLSVDGNKYCFLLGENLQSGIAGFGDTAELAAADFDKNFKDAKPPIAAAERAREGEGE